MAMAKEDIMEAIKGLSVLDLAELVKSLEEEFGVSAAAPVAMATVQGVAGTAEAAAEDGGGLAATKTRQPRAKRTNQPISR